MLWCFTCSSETFFFPTSEITFHSDPSVGRIWLSKSSSWAVIVSQDCGCSRLSPLRASVQWEVTPCPFDSRSPLSRTWPTHGNAEGINKPLLGAFLLGSGTAGCAAGAAALQCAVLTAAPESRGAQVVCAVVKAKDFFLRTWRIGGQSWGFFIFMCGMEVTNWKWKEIKPMTRLATVHVCVCALVIPGRAFPVASSWFLSIDPLL